MSKDFMNIERIAHVYRPAAERVRDFNEVEAPLTAQQLAEQSARCMGCGIPLLPRNGMSARQSRTGFQRGGSQGRLETGMGSVKLHKLFP